MNSDNEADVLATYSRTDGRREWVNVWCWLRPGEEIVHRSITQPAQAEPVDTPVTAAEAAEALDSLDDYARMYGVDAIGPRKTLERFIAQQKVVEDDAALWEERARHLGWNRAP